MSFIVTLTAALKAIPEITGAIREIRQDLRRMADNRDDAKLAEYKQKMDKEIERLKHAKDREETARIIADINSIK